MTMATEAELAREHHSVTFAVHLGLVTAISLSQRLVFSSQSEPTFLRSVVLISMTPGKNVHLIPSLIVSSSS